MRVDGKRGEEYGLKWLETGGRKGNGKGKVGKRGRKREGRGWKSE